MVYEYGFIVNEIMHEDKGYIYTYGDSETDLLGDGLLSSGESNDSFILF